MYAVEDFILEFINILCLCKSCFMLLVERVLLFFFTKSVAYSLNVSFSILITSVGEERVFFLLLIVSVRGRSLLFLRVLRKGCIILL